MNNKRGVSTILVLIIAAILLIVTGVVLLYAFGGSIKPLQQLIPGSGNNLQTIVSQCNIACATQTVYDWCSAQRTVTGVSGGPFSGTCNDFSDIAKNPSYRIFGIDPCPTITCP